MIFKTQDPNDIFQKLLLVVFDHLITSVRKSILLLFKQSNAYFVTSHIHTHSLLQVLPECPG